MKNRRLLVAALVAALGPLGFITTMLQAQTQEPEVMQGARIAAQGTAAGAPPCTQCHAVTGVADASGAFPRLTGQSADYLAEQLRDFASSRRTGALMTPIAQALSRDDVADVSAYYAGLDAPFPPLAPGAAAFLERGAQLAKIGSAGQQLQSCDNCHGPDGVGEPPAIPYLAGQYAQYIVSTLQMWQQGDRKNSPDAMAVVAKRLSDQDIAAVAAYYQQVRATLAATEPPRKAANSVTATPESQVRQ